MEQKKNWRNALLFGFITLFLCGIGDWLIGYEPQGGQELIFGITNTKITEVPSWFYVASMVFGVLSAFGCRAFAPVMIEILEALSVDRSTKAYKGFRFGLSTAPLMFISFHTACCIALLLIQAALRAGVSEAAANSVFLLPTAVSIIPFTIWCFVVDIPVTVCFIILLFQGKLGLPKWALLCSPLGMSIFMKIIAAILLASGLGRFAFLTACGESWGYAFMCLAFLAVTKRLSGETASA
ncbi:MAG: hypothetical protein NC302_09950 [Bacteroidales bacterium]|nr:hypothetical protein [Bacteroidales bacterium]MCM1417005.1 hypothetical protein [bacterium]MCM1424485.1 hypothetical protein [bacterium]